LRHYVDDAQATVAIVGQELYERIAPLGVPHVIVATYSDYLRSGSDLPLPDFVRAPRIATNAVAWRDAVAAGAAPAEHRAGGDDLAVMPYTSGTTGKPKGCMHTHATVQATAIAYLHWRGDDGAAMPDAFARKLEGVFRLPYVEGYGLTETMAPSHINPPQRPKRQCAGIPFFNTDARVIDLETRAELGVGEVGEIIVHGPQV